MYNLIHIRAYTFWFVQFYVTAYATLNKLLAFCKYLYYRRIVTHADAGVSRAFIRSVRMCVYVYVCVCQHSTEKTADTSSLTFADG